MGETRTTGERIISLAGVIVMAAACGGVESVDDNGDRDGGIDAPTCVPTATVDTCNAVDDDCDNQVDEDFVPNPPDFTRDAGLFESNWFIGNLLVDWRQSPPTITCPAAASAFEGSSSWSDPETGDLLYYTNGLQLFDALGVLVPNGDALAGNQTATETSLFAPIPGSDLKELFVFVNNTTSVFVSRLMANGEVDLATKNAMVATNTGEAIGAVEDGSGGFWLALLDLTTLDTFHVTDATIPATPTTTSPLPITVTAATRATIRFSRQGNRVALATESPPGHWWADFDQTTGAIVGDWKEIDLLQGYSIDFSPDGTQIYFAAADGQFGFQATELRQHDTVNNNTTVISDAGLTFSGVALAPDGTIYTGPNVATVLHRVNNPDVGGMANFQANALDLGGCSLGFNLSKQMSLPSVGCTNDERCDDGDDCTTDICTEETGECSYTCVPCDSAE